MKDFRVKDERSEKIWSVWEGMKESVAVEVAAVVVVVVDEVSSRGSLSSLVESPLPPGPLISSRFFPL